LEPYNIAPSGEVYIICTVLIGMYSLSVSTSSSLSTSVPQLLGCCSRAESREIPKRDYNIIIRIRIVCVRWRRRRRRLVGCRLVFIIFSLTPCPADLLQSRPGTAVRVLNLMVLSVDLSGVLLVRATLQPHGVRVYYLSSCCFPSPST